MEKNELIIIALKEKIGDLVSNYEIQIAVLRSEITMLMEENDAKEKAKQEYPDINSIGSN